MLYGAMMKENDKYLLEKQHMKDSFTIWGSGIRICPGRKLATLESKCLISLIFRKYDIEIADHSNVDQSLQRIVKIKPRK